MPPSPAAHPFAAIIPAAGAGTRFGEAKAGARLATGERFVDRVAALALQAGARPVVVVLPPGLEGVAGTNTVVNARARSEQIASVRLGLAALAGVAAEGCLMWPVDHPFVSIESALAVVDGFRRTGAPVVVPTFEGRRGHPVFFARALWLDVMTVESGGARAVVHANAARVCEVPVTDAGVVRDIDTRSDMPPGGWRASDALSGN